jgi:hypothetical protein
MVELASHKADGGKGAPADPKLASLRAAARAPRATLPTASRSTTRSSHQRLSRDCSDVDPLSHHPTTRRAFLERGGRASPRARQAVADAKACAFGLREACAQVTRLEPLPPTK